MTDLATISVWAFCRYKMPVSVLTMSTLQERSIIVDEIILFPYLSRGRRRTRRSWVVVIGVPPSRDTDIRIVLEQGGDRHRGATLGVGQRRARSMALHYRCNLRTGTCDRVFVEKDGVTNDITATGAHVRPVV